jgi:hypothetical protein
MEIVSIPFGNKNVDFALDAESKRWSLPGDAPLPEGEFPLVASAGGRRYELYSDGTFAEVER